MSGGHHETGPEPTQANALAEGLSNIIAFLPHITHILLTMATNDSSDRMRNWQHGWKGNSAH